MEARRGFVGRQHQITAKQPAHQNRRFDIIVYIPDHADRCLPLRDKVEIHEDP